MLFEPYVRFYSFSLVRVTEWPPIGKIAAHLAHDMFSKCTCKYQIANLFSTSVFGFGNFF